MSDFDVKEKRFEEDIETYLCTEGGYTKGDRSAFDRTLALDKNTFLNFWKWKMVFLPQWKAEFPG